jgi:hypothetical protein
MYKIIEIKPGCFKLYRKGWIFWHALMRDSGYAGECYMVYKTLIEAEQALVDHVNNQALEQYELESFKHRKQTYFYGEDGYPQRVLKDSNPGY